MPATALATRDHIPAQVTGAVIYDHATRTRRMGRGAIIGGGGMSNALAKLVRDKMEENGWSYADLARACDLPRTTVYLIATRDEQRTTNRPETLERLAHGLELPLSTIRQAAAEAAGYAYDEVDLTPDEVKMLAALAEELSPAKRGQLLGIAQMFRDEDKQAKRGKK